MTDNLLRTISDNLAICLRTGNKCENLLLTVEQLQRVRDLLTGAELKKLYEQVDELRADALVHLYQQANVRAESYSRVLGLINTMLAGREDAVPVAAVWGNWRPIETVKDHEGMFIWARPKDSGEWGVGLGYKTVSGGWADAYGRFPEGVTIWHPMPETPNPARIRAIALRAAQPAAQPTHRYTAAEIEDRLATAGSHPGSDARDLQMLRQVWKELKAQEQRQ